MKCDDIIHSLGLTKQQLFQKYAAYELSKSTGISEAKAAGRVFGADPENTEVIFFLLVGLRWIETEVKNITEDLDG